MLDRPGDEPIKVRYADLKRMGIVRSRPHLHEMIKAGKFRAPHKDGDRMQSAAWWWWSDIKADLELERDSQNAA